MVASYSAARYGLTFGFFSDVWKFYGYGIMLLSISVFDIPINTFFMDSPPFTERKWLLISTNQLFIPLSFEQLEFAGKFKFLRETVNILKIRTPDLSLKLNFVVFFSIQ